MFLEKFTFPSEDSELQFQYGCEELLKTCYNSTYPFGVFTYRELPPFEFEPITVFCGGNGSGKSTVLNVIAEKLCVRRGAPFNKSPFFDEYLKRCSAESRTVPKESRIVTSDDVFDFLLDLRCMNSGIDRSREELFAKYRSEKYTSYNFKTLDDYEALKAQNEVRRLTQSQYVRRNLGCNIKENSNGESALMFFTNAVRENALYLLDEPENSLSPENQCKLAHFLADSVRFFRCQLIISTHSPFLLALPGAKIYDLDSAPPISRPWTELPGVRAYRDFFEEHDGEF